MAEQAGEYNRKIEIWQRTADRDAAGEPLVGAPGWVIYKTKWAKIRGRNGMGYIREIGAQNGKEVNAALDLQSVRIMYDPTVTVDMQVRMKAGIFEIIQIRSDDADREFTDIIVRRGGSDGS